MKIHHRNNKFLFALLSFALSSLLYAQDSTSEHRSDTTFVFGTMSNPLNIISKPNPMMNAMGVDLLISTNGFGLGLFYRHEFTDDFAGYLDFSVSESKDEQEVEFYDPYTGITFVPGKVNRFLNLPLMMGVQKRLFKDDILDNFRPFVNAAVGPTMIYVFPYNEEYFSALGHGHPTYTFGGYLGAGAYFGSERTTLFGLNLRYYWIPYPSGLTSMEHRSFAGTTTVTKKEFGGFYLTFSFGSAW
jgi:hypothetical protein